MPAACERHLAQVKRRVARRISFKYRKGQAEHGGRLWEKPALALVEDVLDEAVDLIVYMETLKEQLNEHKLTK